MVEFALVAPIFFALVVGIIAAGWLFFQATAVADAAQGAAREAIVETSVDSGSPPCESGVAKFNAESIEAAAQKAANILPVDTNPLCQQGTSTTGDTFCPKGGPSNTLVQTAIAGDATIEVCVQGSLASPTAFDVLVTYTAHPFEPLLGTSIQLNSTSILTGQTVDS